MPIVSFAYRDRRIQVKCGERADATFVAQCIARHPWTHDIKVFVDANVYTVFMNFDGNVEVKPYAPAQNKE